MGVRSQQWIFRRGIAVLTVAASLQLASLEARAEGGRFEFSGGTTSSLLLNGGFSLTNVSMNAGMAYNFGAGIQLGIAPRVAYANNPDPLAPASALTVTALVGPTINFVFADDIRDSVYLFLGAGFTSGSATQAGIATSTMTISYEIDLGKRFAITSDLAYKPEIGVNGSLSTSPGFVVTPLNFTFFP